MAGISCTTCRFARCEPVRTIKARETGQTTHRSWFGRERVVPTYTHEWVEVPGRFKWFCHWGDPKNWPQVEETDFCRHHEAEDDE